jgi:Flp pilus assembly protein TadG
MKRPGILNERGIALFSVGVAIFALLALTAVGVDVGRIAFTATEVQNTADIAATAAAKSLIQNQSAQAGADAALAQNSVDGNVATGNLVSLETGSYDPTTRTFTPGGTPTGAVRANASATVTNIVASMIGHPSSTVSRSAIATFTSTGSGTPELPLAIGDGLFPSDCEGPDCSLPQLIQVPSPDDNTGWTGFFDGASSNTIGDFFPEECLPSGSTAEDVPTVEVGDSITLNNGQTTPLLEAIACMVNAGTNEFVIPVVDSTDFNQSGTVVGFVTVVVDEVITTGDDAGITLHAIFNGGETGTAGGGDFGTGFVILVG